MRPAETGRSRSRTPAHPPGRTPTIHIRRIDLLTSEAKGNASPLSGGFFGAGRDRCLLCRGPVLFVISTSLQNSLQVSAGNDCLLFQCPSRKTVQVAELSLFPTLALKHSRYRHDPQRNPRNRARKRAPAFIRRKKRVRDLAQGIHGSICRKGS